MSDETNVANTTIELTWSIGEQNKMDKFIQQAYIMCLYWFCIAIQFNVKKKEKKRKKMNR